MTANSISTFFFSLSCSLILKRLGRELAGGVHARRILATYIFRLKAFFT